MTFLETGFKPAKSSLFANAKKTNIIQNTITTDVKNGAGRLFSVTVNNEQMTRIMLYDNNNSDSMTGDGSNIYYWEATKVYAQNDVVLNASYDNYIYWHKALNAGTSGGSEPTWSTTNGGTVTDNDIIWKTIVMSPIAVITGDAIPIQSFNYNCNFERGLKVFTVGYNSSVYDITITWA